MNFWIHAMNQTKKWTTSQQQRLHASRSNRRRNYTEWTKLACEEQMQLVLVERSFTKRRRCSRCRQLQTSNLRRRWGCQRDRYPCHRGHRCYCLWCCCCCHHLVLFCDGNKEGPVGSLGTLLRKRTSSVPSSLCWCSLFTWSGIYRVVDGYQQWYEQWYQNSLVWAEAIYQSYTNTSLVGTWGNTNWV